MNNNKKKGTIALGLALAGVIGLGTGTYSYWSDTAETPGGVVTSGNLNVEVFRTQAWDASPDRVDSPHPIADLATWRAVPGDEVSVRYDLDLTLKGDNLVALLDTSAISDELGPEAAEYVTVETEVWQPGVEDTLIEPDPDGQYIFTAPRDGQDNGANLHAGYIEVPDTPSTPPAPGEFSDEHEVQVRVNISFSPDTPDQVLTETDLAGVTEGGIEFVQIREGSGYQPAP